MLHLWFVERIGGIALIVEERQTDGTLLFRSYEIAGVHPILLKELDGAGAHLIISREAYKSTWNACAPHTDYAIETAAASHCGHWLPVLE